MATAKQLAARAKFAAMARSGALARKRKSSKKSAVKKNPVSEYRGKHPTRIKSVAGAGTGVVHLTTNAGHRYHIDARDVGGVMPRLGEEVDKYLKPLRDDLDFQSGRKRNPLYPAKVYELAEKALFDAQAQRGTNPKARDDEFPFKVFKAGANDRPTGAAVGAFKSRGVAITFANGYAKMYDCAVVLVGD